MWVQAMLSDAVLTESFKSQGGYLPWLLQYCKKSPACGAFGGDVLLFADVAAGGDVLCEVVEHF